MQQPFSVIPIQPLWYSQTSLWNLESAKFSHKLEEIALTASNFTPQGLDEALVILSSESVKLGILDTFYDRSLVCSIAVVFSITKLKLSNDPCKDSMHTWPFICIYLHPATILNYMMSNGARIWCM